MLYIFVAHQHVHLQFRGPPCFYYFRDSSTDKQCSTGLVSAWYNFLVLFFFFFSSLFQSSSPNCGHNFAENYNWLSVIDTATIAASVCCDPVNVHDVAKTAVMNQSPYPSSLYLLIMTHSMLKLNLMIFVLVEPVAINIFLQNPRLLILWITHPSQPLTQDYHQKA